MGGSQLDRIRKNKLRSLRSAMRNTYTSRRIETESGDEWQCLITSNNIKSDYDLKNVCVEFDSGLTQGDTFKVLDDGTHWMVYLQDKVETAYLRSSIIRCRYTIELDGKTYWVYWQGPTETELRWYLKQNLNVNDLNYSGTIYIKNDEATRTHFKRFTRLKLEGHTWEVTVADPITVPGILELEIKEYYDNEVADLPVVLKESDTEVIAGETVVKQDSEAGYSIADDKYVPGTKWYVTGNERVAVIEEYEDGRICRVKVHDGATGTYTVNYGEYRLECTVDWEEPAIKGPQNVYPYDVHDYMVPGVEGTFELDSRFARILEQSGDKCTVEVVSGKSGRFTLTFTPADGSEASSLDVRIKSM
jgi:uncharacterized cupredoxin-like copper-binding protein